MHTAPATNASSANVLSPGPSLPAQTSGKGSTGTFQDVYQNLPAQPNGKADNQAPVKPAAPRKKTSDGDPTDVPATTATNTNLPATPAYIQTLLHSLGLSAQSTADDPGASTPAQTAAGSRTQNPTESESAQPASSALEARLITTAPPVVSPQILPPASTQSNSQNGNAEDSSQNPSGLSAPPAESPAPASLELTQPAAVSSNVPQTSKKSAKAIESSLPNAQTIADFQGAQSALTAPTNSADLQNPPAPPQQPANGADNSNGTGGASLPTAAAAQSLALTASNLAFTLQLARNDAQPANPQLSQPAAKSSAPLVPAVNTAAQPSLLDTESQPITSALAQSSSQSEASKIPNALPAALNAAPSRALPNIATAQDGSRNQSSSDSDPRQQQDSSRTASPQRDTTTDASKSEPVPRPQASMNTQDSTPGEPSNEPSPILRAAQPAAVSWLSATAQSDVHPQMNPSDPPATPQPSMAASIHDIQPLAAEAPKTTMPGEILLQLDNGQSSAAVRVVDRGGSVSVSVHASDQDLRSSLRANLSDLSTQLNSQGVKTETAKTAASQSAGENRPDQGTQDQRSGNQQHSSPQGDRQSSRDRRPSTRWLDELQEQTSASAGNSGGTKS